MTFYFAWVDPATAFNAVTHSVENEKVFAFEMTHSEGDFAMLSIDIQNPHVNLLNPSRKVWAWLSVDGTAIFFGRLIAAPEDSQEEIVKLNFIARPLGYDATKKAFADTLKVIPFWDDTWVQEQRQDDPDVVLEARPQLWHIDRITHALTLSSITEGEDGVAEFTHFYDSLRINYGAAPLRRCQVQAKVSWDQTAKGSIDLTGSLLSAFAAAGSPGGFASSFTGQGLEADWPKPFQNLRGGWSTGDVSVVRVDGTERPQRSKQVKINNTNPQNNPGDLASATLEPPLIAEFFIWEFRIRFPVEYNVSRSREENMIFTVEADVQPIVVDPGDDESEIITLSSRLSGDSGGGGGNAIDDPSSNSFLKTDQGVHSFEYLLMLARAKLLARARAVNIEVAIPFAAGLTLSCRHSAHIVDDRLPIGDAVGKIIEYRLIANGDGQKFCTVTVGCTIGEGDTITADDGEPTYAEEDYVHIDYQRYTGAQFNVGGIVYDDYRNTPLDDDGLEFSDLTGESITTAVSVRNGEDIQRTVLSIKYDDIPAAIEALNAVPTVAEVRLKPIAGGPFKTLFEPAVSQLMIPKTIQL